MNKSCYHQSCTDIKKCVGAWIDARHACDNVGFTHGDKETALAVVIETEHALIACYHRLAL